MQISDILTEGMVVADARGASKSEFLQSLANLLATHPEVGCGSETVYEALIGRERLGSTGVGGGVAIPHAKLSGLRSLVGCFARAGAGIPFDAIDKQPVKLVFALLVPENSAGMHLKALARISRLLKSIDFREILLESEDQATIYAAFLDEDKKL